MAFIDDLQNIIDEDTSQAKENLENFRSGQGSKLFDELEATRNKNYKKNIDKLHKKYKN